MTQRTGFVPSSTTVAAIALLALTVGWTPSAEADITRIVIARVESPTFGGASFGAVGQYEKLVGRAFGEVDPQDPRNAVIVDIAFAIDGVSVRTGSSQAKGVSGPMRCQLMARCGGDQPIETWTDVEGQPLETRLGDMAVAIVVHGERVCRSSAQHHREWVIKRKAEIAAEERRKEAERRRLERERLERLEKARVSRLLAQAKSLREAEEIRAYVSAVRERQAALDDPLSATGFQQWADWALSQADRIDPVLSGSFRTVQDDD